MYFGENPDKVKNIVTNTLGRFQDLYAPVLKVRELVLRGALQAGMTPRLGLSCCACGMER